MRNNEIEDMENKIKDILENQFSDHPIVTLSYNLLDNSADYFLDDAVFEKLTEPQKTLLSMVIQDLYDKYCAPKID